MRMFHSPVALLPATGCTSIFAAYAAAAPVIVAATPAGLV